MSNNKFFKSGSGSNFGSWSQFYKKDTVDSGDGASSENIEEIEDQLNAHDTALADKVDKEDGKELSENNYTDAEKIKLSDLPSSSQLVTDLEGKVDKMLGKELSDNNFTEELKAKLEDLDVDKLISGEENTGITIIDSGDIFTIDESGFYYATANALNTPKRKPGYFILEVLSSRDKQITFVSHDEQSTFMIQQIEGRWIEWFEDVYFSPNLKDKLETLPTADRIQYYLNNKVDKESGKGLSKNDYSDIDKAKLSGIEEAANKYIHPSSHSMSEVSGLNSALADKVDKETGKGLSENDFTEELRAKLEGIDVEKLLSGGEDTGITIVDSEDIFEIHESGFYYAMTNAINTPIGDAGYFILEVLSKLDKQITFVNHKKASGYIIQQIEGHWGEWSEYKYFTPELKEKLDNLPTAESLQSDFDEKVDKVSGKGLSENDFTDEFKSKLDTRTITTDENQTITSRKKITGTGELIKFGDYQLNGQDGWMTLGNESSHVWRIKYVGSTDGVDGNEFRIESGVTGKYYQMDHNGNMEYFDGSTTHKIWNGSNDGAGSGLDADTIDGLESRDLVQNRGLSLSSSDASVIEGSLRQNNITSGSNTSSSSNYPTSHGQTWTFQGESTNRTFSIHRAASGKNLFLKYWNADETASDWIKLLHPEDLEIALATKVDKVFGKELSSNDFTDSNKTKLDGIEHGANKYIHPATHSMNEVSGLEDALNSKRDKPTREDAIIPVGSSGWYTIATCSNGRAIARFGLKDVSSGRHQSCIFHATHLYGDGNTINVIANALRYYNPIERIRIKDKSSTDGAALQIYVNTDNMPSTLTVYLLDDNFQSHGWKLIGLTKDGDTPDGISEAEWGNYQVTTGEIDLLLGNGSTNTSGDVYSKNEKLATENAVDLQLDNKVDKVTGKALSTNDFTNANKAKLDGIPDQLAVTDTDNDFTVNQTFKGRIIAENGYPRVDLNDTDSGHNDWSIINAHGEFRLYDAQAADNRLKIDTSGDATFSEDVEAKSFKVDGGSSDEFLKADGSLDDTSYISEVAGMGLSENNLTDELQERLEQSVTDSHDITILQPKDAKLSLTGRHEGAIKIILPQGYSATMMKLEVDIFDYTINESIKVLISGYNYSSHQDWRNTSVQILANKDHLNYPVRFGSEGDKCCIYIGELGSVWMYPKVVVSKGMFSLSNYAYEKWISGWRISIDDSGFQGITRTHDDNLLQNITDAEVAKLAGIEEGANKYIHPSKHAMSDVLGLGAALYEKVDKESGKRLSENDFTDADKARLDLLDPDRVIYGSNGTGLTQYTGDLFDVFKSGFYYASTSATNKPTSTNGYFIVETLSSSNRKITFTNHNGSGVYTILKLNGIWKSWEKNEILTSELKNKLENLPENTNLVSDLSNKVDKVSGKGLSENDFTDADKSKLDGIATGANNYIHPSAHDINDVTGLSTELNKKLDKKGLTEYLGHATTPVNTGGWFKIAEINRGGGLIKLSFTGGHYVPVTYCIRYFKDWSSSGALMLEKFGYAKFIQQARIVKDSDDKYYVEIYCYSHSEGLKMEVYDQSLLGRKDATVFTGALTPGASSTSPISILSFVEGVSNSKDQYTAGKIGIGTNAPSEQLEIFDSVTTPAVISLQSSRNDASFVDVGNIVAKQGGDEVAKIGMSRAGQTNSGFLSLWTKEDNDSSLKESMRISHKGSVGIGTTDPVQQLHVNGGNVRIQSQHGYADIGAFNTNWFHFKTDRPAVYFYQPIYVAGKKVATEDQVNVKVDKVTGKGLSENDLTDQLLLETQQNVNTLGTMTTLVPKDARFHVRQDANRGALKIKLPQYYTNTMIKMDVEVFNYRRNASFKVEISGYPYLPLKKWLQTSARVVSNNETYDLPVRFGEENGKCCVYIGDLDTNWAYPMVYVSKISLGFTAIESSRWLTGWDLSIEPDEFSNVTAEHHDNMINKFTNTYQSKLDGIATGANNYIHPSTHSMSEVSGLSTALSGKVTAVSGKALSTNDFSNTLKSKLDGIATGANKYVHPSTHSMNEISGLSSALAGKEATFSKKTAFNKNFGTASGTVMQGNDSRVGNGHTAYTWGNHATANYVQKDPSGNLGIGTDKPTMKLDIATLASHDGIKLGDFVQLRTSGSGSDAFVMEHTKTTGNLYLRSQSSSTYGGNLILNDVGGNVGIGTTSPQQKLHVTGGKARFETEYGYIDLGAENANWYHIKTDQSRFYLNKEIQVDGDIRVYGKNTYMRKSDGAIYENNSRVATKTYVDQSKQSVRNEIENVEQTIDRDRIAQFNIDRDRDELQLISNAGKVIVGMPLEDLRKEILR